MKMQPLPERALRHKEILKAQVLTSESSGFNKQFLWMIYYLPLSQASEKLRPEERRISCCQDLV